MIEGKTSAGFEYKIDDDARDDIELLEDLVALDNKDLRVAPRIITRLLGEEQKKALYDFYRKDTGRVPLSVVSTVISEIFTGAASDKPLKN